MSRWRILPGLAVVVVLLSAAWPSVSVSSPAASAPVAVAEPVAAPEVQLARVRVGTINIAGDAPFHLAQERGYLREEGLDAEFTPFDTGQQMIAPLGAGQLDAGGGAIGPGLANAIQRGINVRIAADWGRAAAGSRFVCLSIRKDLIDSGAVRSIADLRGRVYAEPVPGGIQTYLFEKELRQAGLRPDEVRYTLVLLPDMVAAFANGLIDVAYGVEPFTTLGEERGVSQCWRYGTETEVNFQLAVVLYAPAFVEQSPEAARGFMVAYLRGVRDYYRAFFGDGQGRPEILQLLTRTTPIRDVALLDRIAPTWIDPNGTPNVASLQATQRWYQERGDLPQEVDISPAVDLSFVDYALGRLGRYP